MVTALIVVLVVAAAFAGIMYRQPGRRTFMLGVAVTLGFWIAPFILPPSYADALYVVVGLIGSAIFGLTGAVAWWRTRQRQSGGEWLWLSGGTLVALPGIVFVIYQFLRR